MKSVFQSALQSVFLCLLLVVAAPLVHAANPRVLLDTNQGEIELELFADKAPISVENFLRYVKKGHYDGILFHRVVPGFVIQGGGYTPDMQLRTPDAPIANEAKNGQKNLRGMLAMARSMMPDSASSQFFINLNDNPVLDYRDDSPRGWGYAVFGKVVRGMDVVQKIAAMPTGFMNGMRDVPQSPVLIRSASVLADDKPAARPAP